ncbi:MULTISPECIES: hypothetical protein [unclassified Moorena]|uniref:hypothetical protein n=1 Tax=unclassified Moorena TaxID=2683338 RepID=UPI0025DBB236|nr:MULTISPECIES: hypothetical protein [unclassified Moorena]
MDTIVSVLDEVWLITRRIIHTHQSYQSPIYYYNLSPHPTPYPLPPIEYPSIPCPKHERSRGNLSKNSWCTTRKIHLASV